MAHKRSPHERGVALLVVLLLVTVLSGFAIAMTDDIRFAVRRTANIRMTEQAQWYARGGEAFAKDLLVRSAQHSPGRTTLQDPWAVPEVTYAIDGGSISGHIADAGNCFNLNSVVTLGPKEQFFRRDEGQRQYARLLVALDIPPDMAQSLTTVLVDWIDSDSIPGPQGAEDDAYARHVPPYRTGATLLAEPSELRAMAGYSEEIYRRIRPLVCALPDTAPSVLNINTLVERDAPLLLMLMGDAMRIAEARRVLMARPAGGYVSVDAFLGQDTFAGMTLEPWARAQLGVRTRYFLAENTVRYHGATVVLSSLLEVGGGEQVMTRARRFGRFE